MEEDKEHLEEQILFKNMCLENKNFDLCKKENIMLYVSVWKRTNNNEQFEQNVCNDGGALSRV